MAQHSIFASLDLWVTLYAGFMATLMSLLMTWRLRIAQHTQGLPLSGWLAVIPDTLLGTVAGTFLALTVPNYYKPLDTFSGVGFLAGAGGILGPRLWDYVSVHGISGLLDWLGSASGPLSKFMASRSKEGESNGQNPKPPRPDRP